MPGVARLGDMSTGDPCGAPPRPNAAASPNVFVNNIPAHRLGDAWSPHACPGSPPHGATTVSGSSTVFVNNIPVARIGDAISCGSTIATGSADVIAGG